MDKTSTYEWLNAYLEKTLSEEERVELEKKLVENPTFSKEFAELIATRRVIRKEKRASLQERYFVKKRIKIRRMRRVALAASLVGLFIAVWLLRFVSGYDSGNQLYNADYGEIADLSLGDLSSDNDVLNEAEKQYNNQQFEQAVENFNIYLTANPNDYYILLHKAIAQRHIQGQERNALKDLDIIIKNVSALKQEAEWNKALTYLKLNGIPSCRETLNRIIADPNTEKAYLEKAKTLLKKTKRIKAVNIIGTSLN